MPEYLFRDKETNVEWIESMSITERTDFLDANSGVEQLVYGFPGLSSGVNKKPDAGFRDLLKHIKKGANKGITRSSINTF
jgi:hypothetical protein